MRAGVSLASPLCDTLSRGGGNFNPGLSPPAQLATHNSTSHVDRFPASLESEASGLVKLTTSHAAR